jgi:hypothetical protein
VRRSALQNRPTSQPPEVVALVNGVAADLPPRAQGGGVALARRDIMLLELDRAGLALSLDAIGFTLDLVPHHTVLVSGKRPIDCDGDDLRITDTATRQTRRQIARPATLPDAVLLAGLRILVHRLLSHLHSIPKILIDDAQFGNVLDHPFFTGIEAGHPFVGIRILHKALTVPDDPADVHFVVQEKEPASTTRKNASICGQAVQRFSKELNEFTLTKAPQVEHGVSTDAVRERFIRPIVRTSA